MSPVTPAGPAVPAIDRRGPDAVGRRARLDLVFHLAGGRTGLAHAYTEPPWRVGRALAWRDGVHIILASSAPGLFGDDLFEQCVTVRRGAHVLLTSQSAMQVHPSPAGATARVRSTFVVEDDAVLCCHWDPIIPFAGSRVDQRITVRLAPTARVVWSDGFMAGRVARGECWRFARFAHELRVEREARLEYLERHRIEPDDRPPDGTWTAGDAGYFGSTLASGWPVGEDEVERLHRIGTADARVRVAVDRLEPGVILARFAGACGPAFHDARASIFEACIGPNGGGR